MCLGIHRPTDTTVCKLWMLTHSPLASEKHQGVIPIKLARDEAYLLDLWTHPDYRRQAVALTLAYELSAVAHERYPYLRWVYTHAHKDNEISRHLMEDIYGCWQVQEVTEVQIGNYVDVVPGSDSPKFGPFSKKGRHSGDGFSVPGRPRTGDQLPRLSPPGGVHDGADRRRHGRRLVLVGPRVVRQRPSARRIRPPGDRRVAAAIAAG